MMKPQHAREAAELVNKHQNALQTISDLTTCSSITTSFCGKNVSLNNRSKAFISVRNALIELEHQTIAQLVRRGNQIGLSL